MKKSVVYSYVLMAMYVAMFMVLDYLSNQIGFFRMPQGGTIGLSSIVLLLASYQLGWKKGVLVALLTLPLQIMFAPFYYVDILDFFFEYVLAFSVYGLAVLFPNFEKPLPIYSGVIIVNLIRLGIHWFAGVVYWGATFWTSFTYNAWYMIPTLMVGVILVPALMKRLPKI